MKTNNPKHVARSLEVMVNIIKHLESGGKLDELCHTEIKSAEEMIKIAKILLGDLQ